MEAVISIKQAEEDVTSWLDSLDIDLDKRADVYIAAVIKNVVKAVSRGHLVLNIDEGTVTQALINPLGEKGVTKSITYNSRYMIGEWHDKLKKIGGSDTLAQMFAKLSLLSGEPELMFRKMIKQDWEIASNITVFF